MPAVDALKRSRQDRYDYRGSATTSGHVSVNAYPDSEEKWQRRYGWLWDCYAAKPYSSSDIQALHLFVAKDDNDEEIDSSRRLSRDFQHIVDTDVRALAVRLSLEASLGGSASPERVAEGEAVWRRTKLHDRLSSWARDFAVMGDLFLEPVPKPGGSELVAYDPRHVTVRYSDDGTTLEHAHIRVPFVEDGVMRVYHREITATAVTAWEDDDTQPGGRRANEADSYTHALGVVPFVHVRFTPFGPPEHGLSAAHAVTEAIAAQDSLLSQIRAITNRYANPQLVLAGAKLAAGAELRFGRVFNLPPGADAKYLEASLGQIQALWQVVSEYGDKVRGTICEFMFSGSGANTSGRALDLRADQFRLKMEEVRGRLYGAIAYATQLAVLLDDRDTYDAADEWYRIKAPPVLPIDAASRMALLTQANTLGAISRVDLVRQMQALGLVDEQQDPQAYADALDALAQARAPDFSNDDAGDESDDEEAPDGQ